jgi:hypothetical protein
MVATAPKRSRPRAPVPPAKRLSTPKPTIVDVNTVVDSSWTMTSLVASTTGHWTDHLVGSRPTHHERRD